MILKNKLNLRWKNNEKLIGYDILLFLMYKNNNIIVDNNDDHINDQRGS